MKIKDDSFELYGRKWYTQSFFTDSGELDAITLYNEQGDFITGFLLEDYMMEFIDGLYTVTEYPVPLDRFNESEAPFIYTNKAEQRAKDMNLEPRTAGTIACFGGKPLRSGVVANAWLRLGYITKR